MPVLPEPSGLTSIIYYGQGIRYAPLHTMTSKYPSGIPKRDPPSCEAPREPTIYVLKPKIYVHVVLITDESYTIG